MNSEKRSLFATTRPSPAAAIVTLDDEMAPIRALEGEWARRMGIEDAPYRRALAEGFRAETQRWSEKEGEVVSDEPQGPPPETIFDTETPARGDHRRDKQSPDDL